MKNLKQSNFTATYEDIFTLDHNGNTVYKIFSFGKYHIVNDIKKQNKLITLEGYRPFILSLKPPIFIPIIVFSFVISLALIFIFKYDYNIKYILLFVSFTLYLTSIFLFYTKIYFIIEPLAN